MISEATRKLLLVSKIKGVGKKTLLDLTADRLFYELPEAELHSSIPELRGLIPGSAALSKARIAVETDLEWAAKQDASILSPHDATYPHLLRKLKDRPPLLFVRGKPQNFSSKSVAIIGTREPSAHGIVVAERISKHFAGNGWQVISGLAIGLDTVAHRAALESDGSTVAVLAHGLDTIYPKSNVSLAQRILEQGGLLVSEYAYGTPSFPGHFVERDRIQAALARGVIMVQSGETGGSWHASRAALDFGRWLIIPAPTAKDTTSQHPKSRGNYLIAEGTEREKLDVLGRDSAALRHVFVLRSREDYSDAEERLLAGDGAVVV